MTPGQHERRLPLPAGLGGLLELWMCRLDDLDVEESSIQTLLSAEEASRAAAFRHDIDRARFLRRRWYREFVIARLVNANIEDVRIDHSELGRPTIVAPSAAASLALSTAHRAGVALVALGRGVDAGVDIERIDAAHATFDAAAIFMTPRELSGWSVSLDVRRELGFHRIWTRKEAVLKTLGTGFGTDPRTIDVTDEAVEVGDCVVRIADLDVGEGFAAAAAVRSS